MKFYLDKDDDDLLFWTKIMKNKFTAIYTNIYISNKSKNYTIEFFKNSKEHNTKNAAYIDNEFKQFYLNGKCYSYNDDFTKESWRRFIKMQAFL
jgi:hypothetical protein